MPQPKTKHWCQYCNIFVGKGEIDIQHHERGWRHKNNVQRYLKKQSKGMKKGNAQIAEERKRDQAKAKEKELEEIVEKDDGYYVVDGRPYMEGAFHLNLLRSRRDTLEIEAVWPEDDEWLPARISSNGFGKLGMGMTSILVVFHTQRDSPQRLVSLDNIRIPVAPPPPPRSINIHNTVKSMDEGTLAVQSRDVSTGLGAWTVTRVYKEEESNAEGLSPKSSLSKRPAPSRDVDSEEEEASDIFSAFNPYGGTYRGIDLQNSSRNVKAAATNSPAPAMRVNRAETATGAPTPGVVATFRKRKPKKKKRSFKKSVIG